MRYVVICGLLVAACGSSATRSNQVTGPAGGEGGEGGVGGSSGAGGQPGAGTSGAAGAGGVLVCGKTTTKCDGRCADLSGDSANCTACGIACPGGTACFASVCGAPGKMGTARARFALARAGDTLYVLGGEGAGGDALTACESYDTRTATWATLPSMTAPRASFGAAVALDGRVFAVGGTTTVASGQMEAFDPKKMSWAAVPALPDPRSRFAFIGMEDGRLFVIGGSSIDGSTFLYRPQKSTWEAAMPIPRALLGVSATSTHDGSVWIGGGADVVGNGAPVAAMFRYEAWCDTWFDAQPMTTPRFEGSIAAGPDDRLVATGGEAQKGTPTAKADRFDPLTLLWVALPDMPRARSGHQSIFGSDGRLYVLGGRGADGVVLSSVDVFEPNTNQWTSSGP